MKPNQIICGDCLEVMKDIPDNHISLTVTSPPYDNLRTYDGYLFDFEGIAKELYRITKEGGVVVWVVGDATIKGSETGTSFKQALYFKEVGFNLHDTMIYAKQNPIPLTHNRYEQQFEYMFVLVKGKLKTFNGITEKSLYGGKMASKTRSFYKTNKENEPTLQNKRGFVKNKKLRNNIWFYVVGSSQTKGIRHPAMFPEKLAKDHILSWSNEGDIVLDPMAGSGTVLKMAKMTNRNYVGIEISPRYVEIARKRIASVAYQPELDLK